MAAKNDIDITIGGKTFTLSGVESEAYLREVASYLNEKLRNFSDDAAYWKLPNDMRNVMLQLNLAELCATRRSAQPLRRILRQSVSEQRRAAQTSWQRSWKPSARVRRSRTKPLSVCAKSLRRHGRPCRAN